MYRNNLLLIVLFLVIVEVAGQKRFSSEITLEQLQEKQDDYFVDSDAVILYRNIYLEFGELLEVREARKIFSTGGLEYATWEIGYPDIQILQATTYNEENGAVEKIPVDEENFYFDEDFDTEGGVKIVFPKVKKGSIIELIYRIKDVGIWTMSYQSKLPMKDFKTLITNPNAIDLTLSLNGLSKVPLEVKSRNKSIRYFGNNIPALKKEAFIGSVENYAGRIYVEALFDSRRRKFKDWDDVAKGFWDDHRSSSLSKHSFKELLVDQPYFRSLITRVKGEESDPVKIAENIFYHVQDHMKWNEYLNWFSKSPKEAYAAAEGSTGEINLVLLAMLREAGFDAYPMVAACKHKGFIHFLNKRLFNGTFVYLKVGTKTFLLDASDEFAGFGEMPLDFVNGPALVIYDDKGSELVSTQMEKSSQVTSSIAVKLQPEQLSVSGIVKKRMTGYFARDYRSDFAEEEKEQGGYESEDEDEFLSISNYEAKDIAQTSKPVSVYYDFENREYIEQIGEKIYFEPLLFFGMKENPFQSDVRIYPIDVGHPFNKKYVINFEIPEGYTVDNLPKSVALTSSDGIASINFKAISKDQLIQIVFNFDVQSGIISETYYLEIKQLFAEYVSVSKSKIVLRKDN